MLISAVPCIRNLRNTIPKEICIQFIGSGHELYILIQTKIKTTSIYFSQSRTYTQITFLPSNLLILSVLPLSFDLKLCLSHWIQSHIHQTAFLISRTLVVSLVIVVGYLVVVVVAGHSPLLYVVTAALSHY